MASKQQVHELLLKGCTINQVAERLGCGTEYVRSTIYRNGWQSLAKWERGPGSRRVSPTAQRRKAADDLYDALQLARAMLGPCPTIDAALAKAEGRAA